MIDILKKITFLFALFVGVVNAMDHSISRKESKFDFLKLNELRPWYEKLSAEQKKAIKSNLEKQDEKSLALFKVATQLPLDVQKLVVAHMFDGYSYTRCFNDDDKSLGEYANAVNKFCDKSLCTSFHNYSFAVNFLEVLKKSKKDLADMRREAGNLHVAYTSAYQRLYPIIDAPNTQQHIIFELIQDLMVFRIYCVDNPWRWECASKDQLQSMHKLFNIFSTMDRPKEIAYRYHDSFTLDSFKKQFSKEQFFCLPFFLAPLMADMLPNHVQEYINQTIVEKNQVKELVNSILKNEYQKTRNALLLDGIQEIENPIDSDINWVPLLYKMLTYCGGVCFVPNYTEHGAIGLGLVLVYMGVYFRMLFMEDKLLENPLAGMACVTGLYTLIVSLYNIKKMLASREDTVSLNDLSDLLQRTDIVIE